MSQIKVLALDKAHVILLTKFAVLVLVAVAAPLLGHNQAITGPIVNATLFLAVILLGMRAGVLVGMLPSCIALASGLLPWVMAPMIPFIIVGNAMLVLVFGFLRKESFWLAVISAGFLKFIFLFGSSLTLINLVLAKPIAQKVAAMFSWPQLATALAGGLIAYAAMLLYKRYVK